MYDGHNLPFDADSFDVVIIWAQTFGLLYGKEYKHEFLLECKRVLTNGGLLSYSAHDYRFLAENYKNFMKGRRFYPYADTELYSREQRAKYPCLHGYLATAARVKYPAALQRGKFDTSLLAAGYLTGKLLNLMNWQLSQRKLTVKEGGWLCYLSKGRIMM